MKKKLPLGVVLFVLLVLLFPIPATVGDDLIEGFRNPPDEAKLWAYWWWLNGNVTEAAIKRDLEQMKDKGFGGVVLFDANGSNQDGNRNASPGPTYASPEWRRLFEFAVKEADRHGISVSLNIQSGWNLGGPPVTPEYAAKRLVHSETTLDGGKTVEIELPQPKTNFGYYRDVAVVAFKSQRSLEPPFSIHASSSQKGNSPKNAADSSHRTFWTSDGYRKGEGPTKQKPQWLEYVFAEPTEIDRVVMAPRRGYGPKECVIEAFDSPDDATGRTLGDFIGDNSEETSISFPKQKVKRLRLTILGSYDPQHPEAPRNVQVMRFVLFDGKNRLTDLDRALGRLKLFDIKLAIDEFGGSAPDCSPLMEEEPHVPGEEVARVGDVLDLTDRMKDGGRLAWDAPPGTWTVLRFGYTPTGARVSTSSADWQGLVLDYLSKEAFNHYWDKAVKPVLDPVSKYCGRTVRYLHTDSWEAGGMNWTETFRDEFKKRRGYDPIPHFPVIAGYVLDDRIASNRFLNDFRRTIGDLIADNHYRYFREKSAAEYGLGIHPESGGPHGAPIDSLQLMGISDIPMSEYWSWSPRHRVGDANRFFTKQPASAAHTNGHKIVAAEGFSNIGMHWQESFSDNLKPAFDQAVCEGMNLLVWHEFSCSPDETGFPGQEYFAGTHFNPKTFVWRKSKDFLAYFNRAHFLLQQGLPSADVLEYYGENVPNFTQRKEANTAKSLPGYDYDVASESVLLDRVEGVRDGRIVLKDGMAYRILVLPNRTSMSLAVLRKIETLVRDGATVIGPKPEKTTGLGDDATLKALADKLWNDRPQAGKGRVIQDKTAHEVLKAENVPFDFERVKGSGTSPRVEWVHRTLHKNQLERISLRKFSEFPPHDVATIPADWKSGFGAEIYYVANLSREPDETLCAFRVVGRQPELWDPVSGEIRDAQAFVQKDGMTQIPLNFAPYGSIFVVFRREIGLEVRGTATTNEWNVDKTLELAKPWKVRFDPKWGGPGKPVEFSNLESWTKHEDPAIRYYSGIAVYSQDIEFSLPQGKRVFLEVKNMGELAEVKINGRSCGTIWAAPFRLDITSALKSGSNRIEIEVANHLANRIIGDAAKPESERITKTNIRRLTADTPLVDSGLTGPVRILICTE